MRQPFNLPTPIVDLRVVQVHAMFLVDLLDAFGFLVGHLLTDILGTRKKIVRSKHRFEYLPKGMTFKELTQTDAFTIQKRLNRRPRKTLEYQTPNEVLWTHVALAV